MTTEFRPCILYSLCVSWHGCEVWKVSTHLQLFSRHTVWLLSPSIGAREEILLRFSCRSVSLARSAAVRAHKGHWHTKPWGGEGAQFPPPCERIPWPVFIVSWNTPGLYKCPFLSDCSYIVALITDHMCLETLKTQKASTSCKIYTFNLSVTYCPFPLLFC